MPSKWHPEKKKKGKATMGELLLLMLRQETQAKQVNMVLNVHRNHEAY